MKNQCIGFYLSLVQKIQNDDEFKLHDRQTFKARNLRSGLVQAIDARRKGTGAHRGKTTTTRTPQIRENSV